MRFDNVKSELCAIKDIRPCCPKWELQGFIDAWGEGDVGQVKLRADSALVARRLYGLLRASGAEDVKASQVRGDGFVVAARLPPEGPGDSGGLPSQRCCRLSYSKGAFLARGYVNLSGKGYHWEIKTPGREQAERIAEVLEHLGLAGVRAGRWQKGWVAYLKDAERIAQWLRLSGAHAALLDFEDIRVKKDMRNTVTRRVNYDTANLDRVVAAAMKQIEDIALIASTIGLAALPLPLRELAEMRLAQTTASLAELGGALRPPLTKSGASHRMRQIATWADKIRLDRARRARAGNSPAGVGLKPPVM